MKITVTPVAKPRMTRSDKWNERPVVMQYRAFKDELRLRAPKLQGNVDSEVWLVFVVPMPKSWSKKKMAVMNGKPHQQTPDYDNFTKAFLDATMKQDCAVYAGHELKIWGYEGAIYYGKADYERIRAEMESASLSETPEDKEIRQSAIREAEPVRRGVSRGVDEFRGFRVRGVLPRASRR